VARAGAYPLPLVRRCRARLLSGLRGSTIGFHRVHETSLALGSFDASAALLAPGRWTLHVWFQEHISSFDTADEWARYPEFPPQRAEELDALSGQVIAG
jgi:hypothetical protein